MTVADLIAELQKMPGYAPVGCALYKADIAAHDVDGEPVTLNYHPDLDCFGVELVETMGTWVRITGSGPHFGE